MSRAFVGNACQLSASTTSAFIMEAAVQHVLPAQPRLAMVSFYFDVGGVLIPDKLAPDNARNVFKQLAKRHRFDPDHAHAKYSELQPSLDLGATSLTELCSALGIEQKVFEQHWLAIHPVDV